MPCFSKFHFSLFRKTKLWETKQRVFRLKCSKNNFIPLSYIEKSVIVNVTEIPFPFYFAVLETNLQCQEFKGGRCNFETEGIFRHEKKQAEDTFQWKEVSVIGLRSYIKIHVFINKESQRIRKESLNTLYGKESD